MSNINYNPSMSRYVVKTKVLQNDPLFVVDVGASGGIESYWNVFASAFKAIGFEPLVFACKQLNQAAPKDMNTLYEPYFITADDPQVSAHSLEAYTSSMYVRSSAAWAQEIQKYNSSQAYQSGTQEVVLTEKKTSLDAYFPPSIKPSIDFIKIDTDGHDYEVLHGAQSILREGQALGVLIEAQFHGGLASESNCLRNIDRLLVEMGYTLFDLDVNRYTKRALPAKFCYAIPAQTRGGQALWGDALYLKDPVASQIHPSGLHFEMSPAKILKLACLFELFSLSDAAAELLLHYRDKLASVIDVDFCLNCLTKNHTDNQTYQEYIQSFSRDISLFYPSAKDASVSRDSEKDSIKELLFRLFNVVRRKV
jgi:FkbM family methyltransferase